MRRTIFISSILILIVFSFWLAFIINISKHDAISLGIDIIGGISTFLTLVIALILFNKFGVEKPILEKNTEAVFDLLQEIVKVRLLFYGEESLHQVLLSRIDRKSHDDINDRKLIFNIEYFEALSKLFNLSENVFMPKEIANEIRKLNFYSLLIKSIDEYPKYLRVVIPGSTNDMSKSKFGIANQKQITFNEYMNTWQTIIDKTMSWLSKKSSIPVELNINSKTKS